MPGVKVRKNWDSSLITHVNPLEPHPLHERCGFEDVLAVGIGKSWEESEDVLVYATAKLDVLGFSQDVFEEGEHLGKPFHSDPWGEFGVVEWIHLDD